MVGKEKGFLNMYDLFSDAYSVYIIVISQGVLLGSFSILFILNVLTALQSGRCSRQNVPLDNLSLEGRLMAKIRYRI